MSLPCSARLTARFCWSAGAQIVELEGSHVIMVSRPDAVTQVIGRALVSVATAAAVPTPRQQEEEAERAARRTP